MIDEKQLLECLEALYRAILWSQGDHHERAKVLIKIADLLQEMRKQEAAA
jgi:hypothetical protein